MFYWLTAFSDGGDIFNLFRYQTVRAGGAFLTALIFGFVFGRPLIDLLRRKQKKGQPIRDDGPASHFSKAGTPTMGGLLILSALMVSTLLWARWDNPYVWIVLLVTIAFGMIGFADDYAKVTKQNTKGVSSRVRMLAGLVIAALATYAASSFHPTELTNALAVPLLKNTLLNLGLFFIPFGMIVIVGAANALQNVGAVRALGVEAAVDVKLPMGFGAFASYSYNDTTYRDDVAFTVGGVTTIQPTAGKTVVDSPKHLLRGEFNYDSESVFGRIGVNYMSKRYFTYTNDKSVPGRALVDATIGYRLDIGQRQPVEIQLNAVNLFDKRYVATVGSAGFGFSGDRQTLLAGAPRQVFVTLRAGF